MRPFLVLLAYAVAAVGVVLLGFAAGIALAIWRYT